MVKIGSIIKIKSMYNEPQYKDKIGVVKWIDDLGQLHGTWGSCAIIPEVDVYEEIVKN